MKRTGMVLLLLGMLCSISACTGAEELEQGVVRLLKESEAQSEVLEQTADLTSSAADTPIESMAEPVEADEPAATDEPAAADSAVNQEEEEPRELTEAEGAAQQKLEHIDVEVMLEGMVESAQYQLYDGDGFYLYYDDKKFVPGEETISPLSAAKLIEETFSARFTKRISFYPLIHADKEEHVAEMNFFCFQQDTGDSEFDASAIMQMLWDQSAGMEDGFVVEGQTEGVPDSITGEELVEFWGTRQVDGTTHFVEVIDWDTGSGIETWVIEYILPSEMNEGFGARYYDMIQYLQVEKK